MRNLFSVPRRAIVLTALLLAATPALASDPATTTLPTWDKLSSAQREQLIAPIRERWDSQPQMRERMLDHAKRWHEMTPEQRKRARHGVHRWEKMDPEQRTEMRAPYAKMRTLEPAEREALKAKWRQMTPEQRKEWVKANPPAPRAEGHTPHH